MQQPQAAELVLTRLHEMGITIAIDDFGTGYSSLSYLKRFPIDYLKIDKSFIDGLPGDNNDRVITGAIIALARNLNVRVVAGCGDERAAAISGGTRLRRVAGVSVRTAGAG